MNNIDEYKQKVGTKIMVTVVKDEEMDVDGTSGFPQR